MKKVIALAIVAVMLVCSVSAAAGFTGNVAPWSGNVVHVSYDEVMANNGIAGIMIAQTQSNIDTPVLATGVTEATFWGWASASAEIAGFSYSVNGGEKVTNEAFKWETEQAVIDAGPGEFDSRYKVIVPVTEGTQLVRVYVDFADGTSVCFWTAELTVGEASEYVDGAAGEEPEAPDTADAAIVVVAAVAAIALAGVVVCKKANA